MLARLAFNGVACEPVDKARTHEDEMIPAGTWGWVIHMDPEYAKLVLQLFELARNIPISARVCPRPRRAGRAKRGQLDAAFTRWSFEVSKAHSALFLLTFRSR